MDIRLDAAKSLRGKASDLVVPAIMPLLDVRDYDHCLNDIDKASVYGRCWDAIDLLNTYGHAARSAGPQILCVFTNVALGTNQYLIRCLSGKLLNCLRKVDANTAAKAEFFVLNGGPLGVVDNSWTDTPLPDGRELITGGFFRTQIPSEIDHVFSRAQLFNPVTGKRTETGSMKDARMFHAALLLRNGKVLVAGGCCLNADGTRHDLVSTELYDPIPGRWEETGLMNHVHRSEIAVLQTDGKVMFGDELYDPSTAKWTLIMKKKMRD